ncbi:hypothetical protein ADUPG1_014149 [Aduncisulcus paluster]|uniref:Uncharacterized protein n=1 Tax=Aduncisulcus paluster TaxID=2918883 RepID=A0ABQ5KB93_9EUKA|nr:hypothetical protein ADUPG1_014149 [Aduncisulcus paluster]
MGITKEVRFEFIYKAGFFVPPISRNNSTIIYPDIDEIMGKCGHKLATMTAQKVIKGEGNSGIFTHLLLPFSSQQYIKGVYVCIGNALGGNDFTPSILTFTMCCSIFDMKKRKEKTAKITIKCDLSGLIASKFLDSWVFIPLEVDNVISCEIKGKGRYKKKEFSIKSLLFIRPENSKEYIERKADEKRLREAKQIRTRPKNLGGISDLMGSLPIPPSSPTIIDPSNLIVSAWNDDLWKESLFYDKSSQAKSMLAFGGGVFLSHLDISFKSGTMGIYGVYICLSPEDGPGFLYLNIIDSRREKTFVKVEVSFKSDKLRWYFIPLNKDVISCGITGQGRSKGKIVGSCFFIHAMCFIRRETPHERSIRTARQNLLNRSISQIPKFLHEGGSESIPISPNNPVVLNRQFAVKAWEDSKLIGSKDYDKSIQVEKILKNGIGEARISHFKVTSATPIDFYGAYIKFLDSYSSFYLIFTHSNGKMSVRKYLCHDIDDWHYFSFCLTDVISCEIFLEAGNTETIYPRLYVVNYILFVRKQTKKEIDEEKKRCRELAAAEVCKISKYIRSPTIPHCDPDVIMPDLSKMKAWDDSQWKDATGYDLTCSARKMLKDENEVRISHLSIPFLTPQTIKGANIMFKSYKHAPFGLFFTFSFSYGVKIIKKFSFPNSPNKFDYCYLPINMQHITMCEIEGTFTWSNEHSRNFEISSLYFVYDNRPRLAAPTLIYRGLDHFVPTISNIVSIDSSLIEARDETKRKTLFQRKLNQSLCAQQMTIRELFESPTYGHYTDIFIPFSPFAGSFIGGIYINLLSITLLRGMKKVIPTPPPSKLFFSFTHDNSRKVNLHVEFPSIESDERFWWYLPVNLRNISLCEIKGENQHNPTAPSQFTINALYFVSEFREQDIISSFGIKEGETSKKEEEDLKEKKLHHLMASLESGKEGDSKDTTSTSKIAMLSETPSSSIKGENQHNPTAPSQFTINALYFVSEFREQDIISSFGIKEGETSKKEEEDLKEKKLHHLMASLESGKEGDSKDTTSTSKIAMLSETPSSSVPVFIHNGDMACNPIPLDDISLIDPMIQNIQAFNQFLPKTNPKYDQSKEAQQLMNGEYNVGNFSFISIPFSKFISIHGVYICIGKSKGISRDSPPKMLQFSFFDPTGKKQMEKKFKFSNHDLEEKKWFFLPILQKNVELCQIRGESMENKGFSITAVIFEQELTNPKDIKMTYRCRKKEIDTIWDSSPTILTQFKVQGGILFNPIPRDADDVINTTITKVKGWDDSMKPSKNFSRSNLAQKMLQNGHEVWLSHLSITFSPFSPTLDSSDEKQPFVKGVYICVHRDFSSPSLLFTFTHSKGKKTYKKYKFTKLKHQYEWHFLPIDLFDISLCEIRGKGIWNCQTKRSFLIASMLFIRDKESNTSGSPLSPSGPGIERKTTHSPNPLSDTKIYLKPFSMTELQLLAKDIKLTSSQSSLTSLFENSFPRLKDNFDEWNRNKFFSTHIGGLSPSFASNRAIFTLWFECVSLFVQHEYEELEEEISESLSSKHSSCNDDGPTSNDESDDGSISSTESDDGSISSTESDDGSTFSDESDDGDDNTLTLNETSLKELIDVFLTPLIQIEAKLSEMEEKETEKCEVSNITKSLIRIVSLGEQRVECFKSRQVIPQLSSMLMRVISNYNLIDLEEQIQVECQDAESTSKLYHEFREYLLSVLFLFQTKSEIEKHKKEVILCVQCLRGFVNNEISEENNIHISIPNLNDLIDTFIDHLSRVEKVLEGDVDEEYCCICAGYTFKVDIFDSFLPKISPTFHRILERGSEKKLGGDVALRLLRTLRNISISPSFSTRSSILTLIKPYLKDWLRIYNDSECYGEWMIILSKITLSSDDETPNKSLCSETWPLFHPVLDVVKREFVGDKIVEDDHEEVLSFFSNLCCNPLNVVEISDSVKELLDVWFTVIKEKKHKWGIKYWSDLISMLSEIPSIVPQLSPKFDDEMHWCLKNGGRRDNYSKYLGNCFVSLKKWKELIDSIKRCSDSESTSKLYHEHRDEILSVFLEYQSESEIEEHKKEIILCVQCLDEFVRHDISGNEIYLPIPDLNDLIDTFIDHLSRVEKVLEGDVDEEYCTICMCYTFKVKDKRDSFLPKISPSFQRILERGSEKKLGGDVALQLLMTLKNISISPSFSTRSSILTLIKPYIKDWLRIYNDSECYGEWMIILSKITLSSDDEIPDKSLCSEAWPLFHPVLDVVKREFEGEKIVEDSYKILQFVSNLCCNPSHSLEIYANIKENMLNWFEILKKNMDYLGIEFWSKLISVLSTNTSIVPQISPKFDHEMEWCMKNGGRSEDYSRYLRNCNPDKKSVESTYLLKKDLHKSDEMSKKQTNEIGGGKDTEESEPDEDDLSCSSLFSSSENQGKEHPDNRNVIGSLPTDEPRQVISIHKVDAGASKNSGSVDILEIDHTSNQILQIQSSERGHISECHDLANQIGEPFQIIEGKTSRIPEDSKAEVTLGKFKLKSDHDICRKTLTQFKSDDVIRKETNLKILKYNIKDSSSQSDISSLLKKSFQDLKDQFDEYTTPSAITSNRDLFALCFECLSLFMKHKVTKEEDGEEDIEVILDETSIKKIIDSFLPQMIKVESVLRMNGEMTKEEEGEEEDSGTKEAGVSSITMLLFRILNVSLDKVESIRIKVYPQISPFLSKILTLGISQKLENSFIEDILITCRKIAFAEDNSTKDSLLSILRPHIFPWMRRYPDKKFFLHWTNILKNITLDKDNERPHEGRSSQLWFVFHPVLDVIKDTDSKGVTFDDEAIVRCLLFFAHLSCIPSQAIEIHECIKDDLLDSWFEMVKKKKEEKDDSAGVKYWYYLIYMLSEIPSIVPQLSPKFDDEMYWCMKNGGWRNYYSRYLGNCFASLKKWKELIDSIEKCADSESTAELFDEHRDEIISVFLEYQSKSEIEEHKKEIILCVQCLELFVRHVISGNEIYLPIPDLNDLIDTFIDHLSRVDQVLEDDVDEEYCRICVNYTFKVQDKKDSFLPKISPSFHRILERGSKKKFGGDVTQHLLITLRNISNSPSSSTRSSILTLIKPYLKDWLRIYNDSECYGEWMIILSKITLSSDDETPNKSLCSETWPLFHPVLDVVKREFVGDKIVEDDREEVLRFFSNLCCDPLHSLEIFDNVKDLLDEWFETIKRKEYQWGIIFWSNLISVFSTIPSLFPQICPKFDANMEWCKNNGALWGDYSRYLSNSSPSCHNLIELLNLIRHCPDSTSTSKLYYEYKQQLLSEFLSHESNSEIEEHKKEIILCVQCLDEFVRHIISGNEIYLPNSDLNDLIDTFIDHLSRVEQVLEGDVDEEYCRICVSYSFKVEDKRDSFLPKISPTFHRILERGSEKKLGGDVALRLLRTLRNISISPSFSTRSSILTLIKPYLKDWLRIYNDSECYGEWMIILSKITLSSDDETPNKSLCSEAWPLFHPIFDVVKREFVGDKIVEDGHEFALRFFSNLCCDPSHAIEVYDSVKELLDEWFTVIKKEKHKWGIIFWSKLISMFSTVPPIVPHIYPKFDANMEWCKINRVFGNNYCPKYLGNCYSSCKKLSIIIDSIHGCPNGKSKVKLYKKHRKTLISLFTSNKGCRLIEEHKKEIILGVQCLQLLVVNNDNLPIPELNSFIDTFFDLILGVEEVLGEIIDEEYCDICVYYTFKVEDKSFLHKIIPSIRRILERGSLRKVQDIVSRYLLMVIRNISIYFKGPTISLISPYLKQWLEIYEDYSHCHQWMWIFSIITRNDEPNKARIDEIWSVFLLVIDFVLTFATRYCDKEKDFLNVLNFFSHFSKLDSKYAIKVFDIIKNNLEDWYHIVKRGAKSGTYAWSKLIADFSDVPSIVPQISPKFDDAMEWIVYRDTESFLPASYKRYKKNCKIQIILPENMWG